MPAGSTEESITRFMQEATSLVAVSGVGPDTLDTIGNGLKRLGNEVGLGGFDPQTLRDLHSSTAAFRIIGRHGDGSVLMLAKFPAEAPTPVHNHNSWGVVCVLQGRDRYERWERLDDGSKPDHADLRLVEESTLMPGDVVWFDRPPQDIHAQQGVDGASWELVYFGTDPTAAERLYFDPRSGAVTRDAATR
jgi:hypothetical protein